MSKAFVFIVVLIIVCLAGLFFFNMNKPRKIPTDKIAHISVDDILIKKYKDTAQAQLDYFIKFISEHHSDDTLFRYAVKSDFVEGEINEHMWIQVFEFKEGYFKGVLANEPSKLKKIKYGDTVKVYSKDVEDWLLQDFLTNTEVGGFSRKYIRGNAK